jgi:RNA polymerase sigma-70 factor, ECF subfamily
MQEIDKHILEEAAGGDMRAFEQIYNIASGFVYTVARRVTRNPDNASDVTQEVFLRIYRNLKDFQFRSSFKTWLYRITVNTAISSYNKIQKTDKRTTSYQDNLAYSRPSQLNAKAAHDFEHKQDLQIFLEKLSPDQKTCIMLREIEGLSYKEIAVILKTNINTVRSRLKRAREILIVQNKKEVIHNEV